MMLRNNVYESVVLKSSSEAASKVAQRRGPVSAVTHSFSISRSRCHSSSSSLPPLALSDPSRYSNEVISTLMKEKKNLLSVLPSELAEMMKFYASALDQRRTPAKRLSVDTDKWSDDEDDEDRVATMAAEATWVKCFSQGI